MAGIAGLDFIRDIQDLLKSKWIPGTGGKPPTVDVKWERKVVNYGSSKEETIIIGIDGENPNIFSLRYDDGAGNPIYDWLHDVAVSIEVYTPKSEKRVLELVNEVVNILKTNVLLNINNNKYVQLLPVGITPMVEEYRNIFRYVIDAEAMRLNP